MKLFRELGQNIFRGVEDLRNAVGIFAARLSHIGTPAAASADKFCNRLDDFARVDAAFDGNFVRLDDQRNFAVVDSRKHCSFCCTLITPALLKAFDFDQLDPKKHWHDVIISHESLKLGFKNYILTTLPVTHHPHSSRPWKLLKYKNPLKYYWRKFTLGFDKI